MDRGSGAGVRAERMRRHDRATRARRRHRTGRPARIHHHSPCPASSGPGRASRRGAPGRWPHRRGDADPGPGGGRAAGSANAPRRRHRRRPAVATLPITDAQAGPPARPLRDPAPPDAPHRHDRPDARADWQAACTAANAGGDARAFFASQFEAVQVGDGRAFATGYYEPEIRGALERRAGYEVPVYGRPSDLIDVDLGQFSDDLKGKKVRGRVQGSALVPYYDRTQIEQGALAGRAPSSPGPPIRWRCSSSRSRARGGCACPTATSCASAMTRRTAAPIPASAA